MTLNLFRSIAFVFAVALLQGATLAQEQLTEVERLRWELAAVRSQLHAALAEREECRVLLVPIRGDAIKGELSQLKAVIEAAHPGTEFDVRTGKLTPKPQAGPEKKP